MKKLTIIPSDPFSEKVEILLDKEIKNEEDLWKPIGEKISKMDLSNETELEIQDDQEELKIIIKINYFSDEAPSPSFKLIQNDFSYLEKPHYTKKSLRNVNLKENRKSFYDLVPNNMCGITIDSSARYGLLGTNAVFEGNVLKAFPSELFWIKYYQKLKEGYTDESDLIGDEESDVLTSLFGNKNQPKSDEDESAVELYQMLIGNTKDYLNEALNVNWLSEKPPYTSRQISSCWKLYTKLGESVTEKNPKKLINKANKVIIDLLKIASPTFKQGMTVKSFLIKEDLSDIEEIKKQISTIGEYWENLINSMEAVASKSIKEEKESVSIFGKTSVRRATSDEFKHMQDLISKKCPNHVSKLKEVFMLNNSERTKAYEDALEKAENKEEKELFHGSITSNMISLITAGGPTIHVYAANGRAFGNGSYWADDFDKSLGYTSYSGSRWAQGTSNSGYMLVCKVHYGKPYFPDRVNGEESKKQVENGGYDCCHALASKIGFLKDEIITYDEEHSCIEAILKFE